MTRIAIDGNVAEVGPESISAVEEMVRDALNKLPPSRMITKILVDGREVSELEIDKDSPNFQQLEIKTVDREIWALNGLDNALSSCERVQKSLIRAAEMFREDNKALANRFFVQCIDGLERFYEAVMITRSVLKLNFNLIELDGLKIAEIEKDFGQILEHILDLQEKQDWAELAEKIEFELITNLSFWTMALRNLKRSQSSNA